MDERSCSGNCSNYQFRYGGGQGQCKVWCALDGNTSIVCIYYVQVCGTLDTAKVNGGVLSRVRKGWP